MSKGPAVGNSQEELPVKGAAQRRTDGNDDQHHPQQHPGGQRIEGPEEGLVNAEGQVQQKLQQHGKPAGGNEGAAEDVEIPPADVAQQRHHGGDEHPDGSCHGEGEGQEPVSAGFVQ